MSRKRKIEAETAQHAAMLAFWKYGFGPLGTRQLEQETGITRFTLQTSYGGKMSLFLKVLDGYLDSFETHLSPSMTDGDPEIIARWFENRARTPMLPEAACYGCLMLVAIVEFKGENADINQRADRFFTMLRGGIRAALAAAVAKGRIGADFDCQAMAEVLLGLAVSLNIVIRSATANAAGEPLANSAAQLIRGWEIPRS